MILHADKFPVGTRFNMHAGQTWCFEIRNDGTFRLPCLEGEYFVIRREVGMVQARRYKANGDIDSPIFKFSLNDLLAVVLEVWE